MRLILMNLAAVIVMPDLLVPGMRAKIWERPMNSALFQLRFSAVLSWGLDSSANQRRIPKRIVVVAMIHVSRRAYGTKTWRARPAIMTGIELMMILRARIASWSVNFPVRILKPPTMKRRTSLRKYRRTAKSVPIWTAISKSKFV